MGTKKDSTIYDVAIYCRLSREDVKEDGSGDESASIGTQKAILTEYVRQRGWHLVQTYVDDGYSGTNFQRPGFQSMIQDIEAKRINCVITKDLSRLGRNYLDCGLYLEVFFPEHGVRYISVNDGVDTLNKSAMDITPFRNILNEMYAADVSMKVKSALRARFNSGLYVSTSPPYGYLKDPADHNHLIIDEKAAPVVKLIFQMALDGAGIAKIRNHLNASHILRPAAYAAAERGESGYERHFEGKEDNRYQWSNNSVRAILRSPVYAGNLVGYKRVAVSMKSKKRPSKLPEEWEVIPNTHEGIVTQAQFDTVQRLMTSRRRDKGGSGFDNIFSGILKCADCGYAMRAMSANRRKRPSTVCSMCATTTAPTAPGAVRPTPSRPGTCLTLCLPIFAITQSWRWRGMKSGCASFSSSYPPSGPPSKRRWNGRSASCPSGWASWTSYFQPCMKIRSWSVSPSAIMTWFPGSMKRSRPSFRGVLRKSTLHWLKRKPPTMG